MKQIILIIQADGQTTATAEGFEGNQCRTATTFLKEALGPFTSEKLTPAYFESRMPAPIHEEIRP